MSDLEYTEGFDSSSELILNKLHRLILINAIIFAFTACTFCYLIFVDKEIKITQAEVMETVLDKLEILEEEGCIRPINKRWN